jgi:branched-chain amino acid transport system substrate-binding protein
MAIMLRRAAAAALAFTAMTSMALADITIGVSISTTGPGAALGIPAKNSVELWPKEIDGEKLNVIVLDDAGDPAAATTNARRFANDDKADVIIGSSLTPGTIAVSSVANEVGVPHLTVAPVPPKVGNSKWTFVTPQAASLISRALFARMQKDGVKNVGYIGFSDSYGDLWVGQFDAIGKDYGLNLVAQERYARPDTSVAGQVLKLVAAAPDAVFIGASGTGAALPQLALRERGFTGKIYQTHGAVTFDFLRIAGPAADNTVLASGPAIVPEQQADTSETKAAGLAYVTAYEEKFGPNTRTQFGPHINDAFLIIQNAVPEAKKKAQPGTPEFRAALRDAIESAKNVAASQGVYNFTPEDHFGMDERAVVLLTVKDGKFVLEK